jgi:hypothetical protein
MIEAFKKDILSLNDQELVNKYYLSGAAFVFDDDHQYRLRQTVADFFHIDFTQVFLAGSAKLGFSIKPQRRFLPFYDKSDIDVVLVCPTLFEEIWREVFSFERNGGYWPKMNDFKSYHFQGWIRPDKLPLEPSFALTKKWWDFFESLCGSGNFGPYKIRGGLYHSRFFFESYQRKCFEQCRLEV